MQEYDAIEHILKSEKHSNQQIKEHIIRIGYKLEKLFTESGNDIFVSEISELILKTLRKRGLSHISRTVYRWFDDFPNWKIDYSSRRSLTHDNELSEHYSIRLEQIQHAYKILEREFNTDIFNTNFSSHIESHVKKQIGKLYDIHDDLSEKFKTLYKEKGWVSIEEDLPMSDEEKLRKSERIHMKKPDPIEDFENPALQGAIEFDEQWHKIIEKLRIYPVSDLAKSKRLGNALREFATWYHPEADSKWRATRLEWMQILLGLKTKSINNSANLTRSADLYGKMRHITKERISDNQYEILKLTYDIMIKIPGVIELAMWTKEDQMPYRKHLSNAISPKLSAHK